MSAGAIGQFLLNNAVGFVVGIGASFAASVLYAFVVSRKKRQRYGSLVGVWVEANDVLTERPFSICRFFFSASDGKLRFNGQSYSNDAQAHYEWWSVVLYIDERERRLSYIYGTKLIRRPVDGTTANDEGFGSMVLDLDESKNRWNVTHGYFLDLDEKRPREARMVRFDDLASRFKLKLDSNLQSDQRRLVELLIRNKDNNDLRAFLGW